MEKYQYKTLLSANVPIFVVEKVLNFQQRYRIKTKSEAVEKLIDLALKLESKLGLVETIRNEELDQIKEQLEKGQLVDYIEQMDPRTFSLVINIMRDEEKIRNKKIAK